MESASNEARDTFNVVVVVGVVALLLGLTVGTVLGPRVPFAAIPAVPLDCIAEGTCAEVVGVPRVETFSRDVVIDLYKEEFGEVYNHIVPCHLRQGGSVVESDCSVEVPLKGIEAEFIGDFASPIWRVSVAYNLDGNAIHSIIGVLPKEADAWYLRRDDLVEINFVYDFDGVAWREATRFTVFRYWWYDLSNANWSDMEPTEDVGSWSSVL